MKLWLGIFVLLTAFALSVVAAWFSIVGMVALFSASAIGVIAMMTGLEFGKLVASGVLKMNWDNPNFNWAIKGYLLAAIATLMVITSIGIYGYLSAGHLEQKAPLAGLTVQAQQLEVKLAQRESENKRIESRLSQIDENVSVFLKNDQATKGLAATSRLSAESNKLQRQLDANNEEINKLNEQLVPLKMQSSEVEAKLGPVKYVAALFGWQDTESAVRLVIIIIMVAFDPLAVVLMLTGLIILREWMIERKPKVRESEPEVDDEVDDEDRVNFTPSCGCVFKDLDVECQNPTCRICPEPIALTVSDAEDTVSNDLAKAQFASDEQHTVIQEQAENIARLASEIAKLEAELAAVKSYTAQQESEIIASQTETINRMREELDDARDALITLDNLTGEFNHLKEAAQAEIESLRTKLEETEQQIDHWKNIAHTEFQRAYEWFERDHDGLMEREKLLALLEKNPSIVDEIEDIVEGDVAEQMTDRQKLLDLLERDPTLINDMAEIIASTITGSKS